MLHVWMIYLYMKPQWPLCLKVNPPKQGLFSNKNKGHVGSRYMKGEKIHMNSEPGEMA